MWELDHKEDWVLKNWWFWTVVLDILESVLDYKEIKPVNPKGNQSWIFIGRTDAEAEAPILWPPDAKNWLIGKDPDAGKDWRLEKWATKDEGIIDSIDMSLRKLRETVTEKGMASHSSVLAWRIPAMGETGGLPSMGSHRVGHNWSDLAAVAAARKQWRIGWSGMPKSMVSQRIGYDQATEEGFPNSSVGKESACNAGDPGLIPGSWRSAGKGIGYLFQYSWASLVAQLVKNHWTTKNI